MQPIPEKPIQAVVEAIAEQRRLGRTPVSVVMTDEFYWACRKQFEENATPLASVFTIDTIEKLPIKIGESEWGHFSVMNSDT